MIEEHDSVMARVRRALGNTSAPPAPPALPDEIVRMVRDDAKLAELFAQRAAEMKMHVAFATPQAAHGAIVATLRKYPIKRVALSVSPLFDGLNLDGFDSKRWDEMTLDELYDFDAAITDVSYAVAESGTIVIKPTAQHGRGLSLVPMYHIAVVEEKQILPDMLDLFDRLSRDPDRSNFILISGPSKTADIEMNVVTGVHGPNVVETIILR